MSLSIGTYVPIDEIINRDLCPYCISMKSESMDLDCMLIYAAVHDIQFDDV